MTCACQLFEYRFLESLNYLTANLQREAWIVSAWFTAFYDNSIKPLWTYKELWIWGKKCMLQPYDELGHSGQSSPWLTLHYFLKPFTPGQGYVRAGAYLSMQWQEYSLDRSPIHSYLQQPACCMSLDCGRKPECLAETHADTGRTNKLYIERTLDRDLYCEAKVLFAAPLCCLLLLLLLLFIIVIIIRL